METVTVDIRISISAKSSGLAFFSLLLGIFKQ